MMDHEKAYAQHIAAAIRHKKAMKAGGELGNSQEADDLSLLDSEMPEDAPEAPVDPKAARKERLKAILAR